MKCLKTRQHDSYKKCQLNIHHCNQVKNRALKIKLPLAWLQVLCAAMTGTSVALEHSSVDIKF